jgi:hypothetical protein
MEFNGVDWTWVAGRGNAYLPAPEVNIDSIVTHELGHAAGLAHEPGLIAATMFYAYFGGDWQASIAGDDRRGLCELYGNQRDECEIDEDCAIFGADRFCTDIDGVRLCDEPRDDLGAECSVEYMNCAEYCVLDRPQEGAGYCSVGCTTACPDGWECGPVDDTYVPIVADISLCFPAEGDDDDDDDDDDDGQACEGCSGGTGATALPLFALLGLGRRRR